MPLHLPLKQNMNRIIHPPNTDHSASLLSTIFVPTVPNSKSPTPVTTQTLRIPFPAIKKTLKIF